MWANVPKGIVDQNEGVVYQDVVVALKHLRYL